ncbi:MAG: hypothetical protein GY821_11225 [Gammaproteobacteria bacterium]|nr:hypothetical protein [Gammaproteobacteria bacterium]
MYYQSKVQYQLVTHNSKISVFHHLEQLAETAKNNPAARDLLEMIVKSNKFEKILDGIVKSEVRQSHSIFLRMFFENIQPVTRHYGAPWGAY